MVSVTQSLTPDPVHGTPANPQSWNRYPYVLNDPLTLSDPLGGPTYDASFVGCYPDPFYEGDFGCGWLETGECPPGFVEVHGPSGGPGYPAIANMDSLHQYANDVLWPAAERGLLSYALTASGVNVTFGPELSGLFRNNILPVLAAAGAEIVVGTVGWSIIIEGLQLATLAVLAKLVFDQDICWNTEVTDEDGNPVDNEPVIVDPETGKLICFYECEDGDKVSKTAEVYSFGCRPWIFKWEADKVPRGW